MKKFIIILTFAALVLSSKTQAQGLFFTSYGTQQLWGMPAEVQWALESNYYDFHMVHTRRFYDRGRLFFDVVLQRRGVFVDIRIDGRGYIFNSAYRNNYPFYNHVCSGYCGFHRDYYISYRVAYGHPYYHQRNHIYYRPNVVYVKYDHGKNHGYYKSKVNNSQSYRVNRSDNGRVGRVNRVPARGSRPSPAVNRGNNGVRDHGAGVGRGNSQGIPNNGNVGNNPNKGPRGNNGVRDHGVGVGRGNGQGKGQGNSNGNGNNGRSYQTSSSRSHSSAGISSAARTTSSAVTSSRSSSRVSGNSSSGRSGRSSNSSSSGRSSSGRTVRTR